MISRGHLAKVRGYIELGRSEGATLLVRRPRARRRCRRACSNGNFVLPTVFADVDNRMRIAQEEIFGPVACLIPFDDEADAIAQRQRHRLRPVELRLDREPRPRAPRRRRDRGRHVLRQQPERARPAPAVRRHQGVAAPAARAAPGATRCSSSRRTCCVSHHGPPHSEVGRVNVAPHRKRQMGPSQPSPREAQRAMSLYGTQKFLLSPEPRPGGADALSRRPARRCSATTSSTPRSARRSSPATSASSTCSAPTASC